MNWFRKKHLKLPDDILTSRIRGFILDSQAPSAHHMSLLLGLSPMSDEVAEHEEEDSDIRVSKIDHLLPVLFAFSTTMAEAAVAHQKAHIEDEAEDDEESILSHLPPEIWDATQGMFTTVSMNTLVGAVSQLVDMGFLEVKTPKSIKKVFNL